jgi:hypothetical protein
VDERIFRSSLSVARQVQALGGIPQTRDQGAPADHQSHVESFLEFLTLPVGLHALKDVVIDKIYPRIFILTCLMFTRTIFVL